MDTDRVFIGYDHDNIEVLKYKNKDGILVDLLNADNKNNGFLDKIPFSTITNLYEEAGIRKFKKHMLKSLIKALYIYDRDTQIDINDIYIGKLVRVSEIIFKRELIPASVSSFGNGTHINHDPINEYDFKFQTVNDNMLLFKSGNGFLDLVTGKVYLGASQINCRNKNSMNELYISDKGEDLIPANTIFTEVKDRYVTKKLMLERFNAQKRK